MEGEMATTARSAEAQDAIDHAVDVRDVQPDADLEQLMWHVESAFPDLSNDDHEEVEQALADKYFGGYVERCYHTTVTLPA
jgi:hypothetical protein